MSCYISPKVYAYPVLTADGLNTTLVSVKLFSKVDFTGAYQQLDHDRSLGVYTRHHTRGPVPIQSLSFGISKMLDVSSER